MGGGPMGARPTDTINRAELAAILHAVQVAEEEYAILKIDDNCHR
jgi:hypothetical protein